MQNAASPPPSRRVPRLIRERRWWLLLLLAWSGTVGLSLYLDTRQIRQQMEAVAVEGARNMFRMVLLARNWNASHGGVYVPVTPRTQPNPYLDVPDRDLVTRDGKVLTMINPAYMTRLIGETAESTSGAVFRLSSLKPVRPGNAPDDWERHSLLAFEQGERERIGVEPGPDGPMLRYMAPLEVKESCLPCHARQGYKVGDVRGGLSVSQRYGPIEAAVQAGVRRAWVTHGSAFLLVLAGGWLLLETLRRRWLELGGKIRELEETQGQLLQSEKMAAIGQLAAGVAHEINNPVGFVRSNLGSLGHYSEQMLALLERCRAGQCGEADFAGADFDYMKEDLADLLRESREGLERIGKIVADLKEFSHVDQAPWQEADLNAGVASTLNVLAHQLQDKGRVVLELGELPPVPCVAAQINQVLLNLLVNAVRAIGAGGTITVRSGQDGNWAWVEVADTGEGMPETVLQRIFEPFYTTRPVGQGTGLGLSIAYDIVRKHGGEIQVRSAVGAGSTFRVCLPLDGQPPASAGDTPAPGPDHS